MPPTHYQAPQPSSQVLVTNNQINIQQYNDIYLYYQSEKMPTLEPPSYRTSYRHHSLEWLTYLDYVHRKTRQ